MLNVKIILFQGHGPSCNGTPLKRGVTEQEKEEILDIHNKWRSTIAQGKERRGSPGPQPGASDMKIMVRDRDRLCYKFHR